MRTTTDQAGKRGRERRAPALLGAVAVLASGALTAGLAFSAGPAYANVISSNYTIGAPSGAVTGVTATPAGITKSQSTGFEVGFTVGSALSGSASDWVSVSVNGPTLGSVPTNIDLVGSSCIQTGTSGTGGPGTDAPSLITIELGPSCTLAAGTHADVDFNATAPGSTGSLSFSVTTSRNTTAATSNNVTINNSGASLTAALYAPGANTTYAISGVPVTSSGTSVIMTSGLVSGSGTISFINSPNGSGYTVTYTPSGVSATSDPVTAASSTGSQVTLTLQNAITAGGTISITATGSNPSSAGTQNDVSVEGATTNSITFGGSVTGLTVAPASTIAGADTTYTVNFQASDALSAGGDIMLAEASGPTNFSTVTGIEVSDNTQNWHLVPTGTTLASGTATIPVQNTINAHDSITLIVAGVTNPPTSGNISDFSVSTTSDPVAAIAPVYAIGANASPGVVVTVNPTTAGATAVYTLSNVHATATLAGGSGTIQLVAPAGTVFPNNPSFYSVADSTTSGGSGTVSAALSGGGTSTVTFTVPNTINSGDVFTISIEDVINPSTSSSTDAITLVGNVTGPTPTAPTTTTTTRPTTTTTKPKPKPKPVAVISGETSSATVTKGIVYLKLKCTVLPCKGTITLKDVVTKVAGANYHGSAGQMITSHLGVNKKGLGYLRGAKAHTIKVWEIVTVSGGKVGKFRVILKLG